MSVLQKLPFTALLLICSLSSTAPAALNEDSPQRDVLPQPSAELAPGDVVRIVIDALAQNDDPFPDAGIETTFGFASPANRANTGPLDRFVRMVKAVPYGVMVDHVASDISEVVMVGEDAFVLVILTTRDGTDAAFAFRLSRQTEGRYRGMWMTDAVWPVNKPQENLPGA